MCTTCGCSDGAKAVVIDPATGAAISAHTHAHGHTHPHDHDQPHDRGGQAHGAGVTVELEHDVLAENNRLAERNRGWFEGRNILALNLMSSPGAGKTALLERTLRDLGRRLTISVIEGDQETALDAARIRATGCAAVQVNTGAGCHLDAHMLRHALDALAPPMDSLLMIENVGNLVCPALFDLGESVRVVILSVTEGDDKPLKYPHMFRAADLVIVNKLDLLPYVAFDVETCIAHARRVNPDLECLRLSATTGEGLDGWYDWLMRRTGSRQPADVATRSEPAEGATAGA